MKDSGNASRINYFLFLNILGRVKVIASIFIIVVILTGCSQASLINEDFTELSSKNDIQIYPEEYEDYPNYFTSIIQEIKSDDSGVGLYSVMDMWWDRNLYDALEDGKIEYVYCEYSGKEYTCEINGESYSFDLQDELMGTGKWNWWTAGTFFDEEKDTVYICLNNAFPYQEDMVQTPHLILIEFSTEKPEEYQVWSYEVEPPNLFSAEVRKCYRLGDKLFIAGQTGDASIDLNTKQLRYYTKERLALEDFVNEKYGEEGYQAVFFRAVYEQDGVTVYSVHVSEAIDIQPVAVVYAAVQNEKVISYMKIDLVAEYMKDGGIENIEIEFIE